MVVKVPGEYATLALAYAAVKEDGGYIKLADGTHTISSKLAMNDAVKEVTIIGNLEDPSAVVLDFGGLDSGVMFSRARDGYAKVNVYGVTFYDVNASSEVLSSYLGTAQAPFYFDNGVMRRCVFDKVYCTAASGNGCGILQVADGVAFDGDFQIQDVIFKNCEATVSAGVGAYIVGYNELAPFLQDGCYLRGALFYDCAVEASSNATPSAIILGQLTIGLSPYPFYMRNVTIWDCLVTTASTVRDVEVYAYGDAGSSHFDIENCLFEKKVGHASYVAVRYTSAASGSAHDGTYGNFPVADPKFADVGSSDYRLLPGSDCLNSGNPALRDPDGSRISRGAYWDEGAYDPTEPSQGGAVSSTPIRQSFGHLAPVMVSGQGVFNSTTGRVIDMGVDAIAAGRSLQSNLSGRDYHVQVTPVNCIGTAANIGRIWVLYGNAAGESPERYFRVYNSGSDNESTFTYFVRPVVDLMIPETQGLV